MSRRRRPSLTQAQIEQFDAFERDAWNQRGQGYEATFRGFTAGAIPALLDAVDDAATESGGELLDVGTGPGWVAAAAATRGGRVAGIDVSETMIELARARVPDGQFRRASATDLGVPSGSVDAVVGNFVLLHVGRPEHAVAEAARVLRPGGIAAFTVWDQGAVNRALGLFHEVAAAAGFEGSTVPPGPDSLTYADRRRFAELLTAGGLADVQVLSVNWTFTVKADDWWRGVLASTPRTGAMFAGRGDDALGRARAIYDDLAEIYQRGSMLELPAAAVMAVGTLPS
jgi:ubiquinone/menaquinone biosynthesis C-methylase UbiE